MTSQLFEKFFFRIGQDVIRLAHPDGHFVGKRGSRPAGQWRRGRTERDPLEEHILVNGRRIEAFVEHGARHFFDQFALRIIFAAVGKGRHEADGEKSFLLFVGEGLVHKKKRLERM